MPEGDLSMITSSLSSLLDSGSYSNLRHFDCINSCSQVERGTRYSEWKNECDCRKFLPGRRLPDCPIVNRLGGGGDHTEDRGACNNWPQQAGEGLAVQKSVLHCKHLEEDMMCGIGLRDKFMVGWTDVCDRRWQLGDGRSSSYCDNWPLGPHMTIGHRDRTYCINIQYFRIIIWTRLSNTHWVWEA